jgi:hypothetical protein
LYHGSNRQNHIVGILNLTYRKEEAVDVEAEPVDSLDKDPEPDPQAA